MDRFTAHLDRAWDLVSKGDTTGAFVSARRALEIDSDSPEVHNLVGYIHAMDGDIDDALASYQHAMALDDRFIDPILNTAELLIHPDADPELAIRMLREVVDGLDRESEVEAILLETEALLNLGRNDEARTRLADISDPDALPDNYAVFVGRALYETGDVSDSRRFFERTVNVSPENADAWYYLGLIARDEGRRIDSVKAFTATLAADEAMPGPPWAKYLEPAESLVEKAIAELGEQERAALANAEIILATAPTQHQIQNELDPRQVVFAEGIDPERSTFERLWVFTRNISRSGVMPESAVAELAQLIQEEVLPSPRSL